MILAVPWAQGKALENLIHCLSSRSVLSPGSQLGCGTERQGNSVNIMRQSHVGLQQSQTIWSIGRAIHGQSGKG